MAKKDEVSLAVRCIHKHDFILSPDIKLKLKSGNVAPGFTAICPDCGGAVPVKNAAVGKMLGLGENATIQEILSKLGLDQDQPGKESEVPETPGSEDAENKGNNDAPNPETGTGDNGDGTMEEGIREEIPPVVEPPRKSQTRAAAPRFPSRSPQTQRSIPSIPEDSDGFPTSQEILLEIVQGSALPPDTVNFLVDWIYTDPKWEDSRKARDLFVKAGIAPSKADQIAKRFESTMELIQRKATRSEDVASLIAGNLGKSSFGVGMDSQRSFYSGRPGGSSVGGSLDDDLETLTINAVVEKNGGRLTPEVLAQIDEIRAMFATRRGVIPPAPGFASQSASPMSIQQMIQDGQKQTLEAVRQIMNDKAQKEREDAEVVARRAADEKRYNDMMQMMQMVITNKNSVPLQPPESPEKTMLMELVKETLAAKNNQAPPKALTDDPLFMKLFDKIIDGKPNEVMQGVFLEIQALKDKMDHIGGGPMGLPSNPDQLHQYVEYMKTMHEIDKTKNEYTDRAETRKLFGNVLETGLKTVGEAVAAAFVMNPGTPDAQQVTVSETPVDDGSVIRLVCPGCGADIHAPVGAAAIQCPNCKLIMDRAGKEMSEEQLVELRDQVMAERRAAGLEPPAEESEKESPESKQEVQLAPKKPDPQEMGPVSRTMQQKPTLQESTPAEMVPSQPTGEENNLTSPEKPAEQGA